MVSPLLGDTKIKLLKEKKKKTNLQVLRQDLNISGHKLFVIT